MGGLLLGLASSLHCAGMCGGIGASLAMGFAPDKGLKARAKALAAAQAGKSLSYVLAGLLVGALGSAVYGLLDRQAAFQVARIAGASALIWTGLSLFGVVPSPAILQRAFAPVRRWAWSAKRSGGAGAGVAGLVWGLMPCGMVYAALLYAMLAGGAVRGGLVMLGFAVGVTPAVSAAALGVSMLPRFAQGGWGRATAGSAMIGLAVLTLFWPEASLNALCLPS
jgi:hypothetical protein